MRGVVSPAKPKAEGPPTVGCPRLLIQDIRNQRTRQAVVRVDPLNMDLVLEFYPKISEAKSTIFPTG
jgi:hypothetical protein